MSTPNEQKRSDRTSRIGVTGGRDFDDMGMAERTLSDLPADATLVYGCAPGADTLAAVVWRDVLRREVDPHPADWDGPCRSTCRPGHRRKRDDGSTYCPAAGVYRNQEMVDSGLDLLIAFPGGRGTADMRSRCRAADVRIVDADAPGPEYGRIVGDLGSRDPLRRGRDAGG